MIANDLRDLKELAAGRSPVGNGLQAVARAVLELVDLAEGFRALAEEVGELSAQLALHVHQPAVTPLMSGWNATQGLPKHEEAP